MSVTSDRTAPRAAQIIDGTELFLIPGLWDMHAHDSVTNWRLGLYVANGVTGIRDMGAEIADLDPVLQLRREISAGTIIGPQIVFAGPILDDAPDEWPMRLRVKTSEEARRAVRMLKGKGVDLVKVHDHTPRDAYFAIADETRHQGLTFAGHVPLSVTLEEAMDSGQRSIEHLSNMQLWRSCSGGAEYRQSTCRPLFETLARKEVWQTPTLFYWSELPVAGTPQSRMDAAQLVYTTKAMRDLWAMNSSMFASRPELVREVQEAAIVGGAVTTDMWKAGVGVLAGCDGLIAGFCLHDELAAMVDGGMTPLAALQTATINPARYFGRDHIAGSVAQSKEADLVLLDANPLDNINNVRRIRAVVVAGRFLDREELDKMLADASAAAAKNE